MREHSITKIRQLLESDKQIRDAERSGDIGQIIKAYKRLGLPGGAKAAFGRGEIGGWNRRIAKGFKNAASASAFVEGALSRNYAVICFYGEDMPGFPDIVFFTRGQKDPSKRFIWGSASVHGRLTGKFSKSFSTPRNAINNIYANFEKSPSMDLPKFAVIPRTALPKPLRTGEDLQPIRGGPADQHIYPDNTL